MMKNWIFGIALLSVCVSGCPATVGPYVTDIFIDQNGRILYRRCTSLVSNSGGGDRGAAPQVVSENYVNCETVAASESPLY